MRRRGGWRGCSRPVRRSATPRGPRAAAYHCSAARRSRPRSRKLPSRPDSSHSLTRTVRRVCASRQSRSVSIASSRRPSAWSRSSSAVNEIQLSRASAGGSAEGSTASWSTGITRLFCSSAIVSSCWQTDDAADCGVRTKISDGGALDPLRDAREPVRGGRDVAAIDPDTLAPRLEITAELVDEALVGRATRVGDECVVAGPGSAPVGRDAAPPDRGSLTRPAAPPDLGAHLGTAAPIARALIAHLREHALDPLVHEIDAREVGGLARLAAGPAHAVDADIDRGRPCRLDDQRAAAVAVAVGRLELRVHGAELLAGVEADEIVRLDLRLAVARRLHDERAPVQLARRTHSTRRSGFHPSRPSARRCPAAGSAGPRALASGSAGALVGVARISTAASP